MNKYILLKDMPGAKAGSVLHYHAANKSYVFDMTYGLSFPAIFIENHPDWFRKDVNEIEIKRAKDLLERQGYTVIISNLKVY